MGGKLKPPTKLALHSTRNTSVSTNNNNSGASSLKGSIGLGRREVDIATVEGFGSYDLEGPHAGSLGLAGGPQPRRIRFGNFLKSLVGLRPSIAQTGKSENASATAVRAEKTEKDFGRYDEPLQIPSSPEITITRTPSEQNMVVMRDPSGRSESNMYSSREKLAERNCDRFIQNGSTSSLNVMQQKLWNIVRREGSALSLHQEKSQSIVHYTGLRKCETVLALTRQMTTSPTMGCARRGGAAGIGIACSEANMHARNRLSEGHRHYQNHPRLSQTGSGIFSASGVEQIRPLNRLRNSVASINNTCSRCSSLLSLAASTSRFSLNNPTTTALNIHSSQQHLRNPSNVSSSNISSLHSRSGDPCSVSGSLQFTVPKAYSQTSASSAAAVHSQRNSFVNNSNASSAFVTSPGCSGGSSSRTPSLTSPTNNTTTAFNTAKLANSKTTLPTDTNLAVSTSPQSTTSTTFGLAMEEDAGDAVLTRPQSVVASLLQMSPVKEIQQQQQLPISSNVDVTDAGNQAIALVDVTPLANAADAAVLNNTNSEQHYAVATRPFEIFTCKLCLIDVEGASFATTLQQCGCQFCTEVSLPTIFSYLCFFRLFTLSSLSSSAPLSLRSAVSCK